jgi:hypothetical protein
MILGPRLSSPLLFTNVVEEEQGELSDVGQYRDHLSKHSLRNLEKYVFRPKNYVVLTICLL